MADEPNYRFIKVHTDAPRSAVPGAATQGEVLASEMPTIPVAGGEAWVDADSFRSADSVNSPAEGPETLTIPGLQSGLSNTSKWGSVLSEEEKEAGGSRAEFEKALEELERAESNLHGDVPMSGARIAIIVVAVVCLVAVVVAYALGAF